MIILNKDDLTEGFEIEPNTLINDDCLNAMKFIPDNSISMILTDPPYGTTACKWDSIIPLEPMWEQLKRIIKPNGAIVMTASQPFTSAMVMSNPKQFKHSWVWEKNAGSNFGAVKYQPMKEHEDVLVFCAKSPTYNPQMQSRSPAGLEAIKKPIASNTTARDGVYGVIPAGEKVMRQEKRVPRSIQRFNRERGLHPTQKPVALMEYLIKTYTNEGETVLDFTAGSFTTGVACVNLNRSFIGIEMDKSYFDIGVNRVKERIKCLDLKIEPTVSKVVGDKLVEEGDIEDTEQ